MCWISSVCLSDHSSAFSTLLCALSSCPVWNKQLALLSSGFCCVGMKGEWGQGIDSLSSLPWGYHRLAVSLYWKLGLLEGCPLCFKASASGLLRSMSGNWLPLCCYWPWDSLPLFLVSLHPAHMLEVPLLSSPPIVQVACAVSWQNPGWFGSQWAYLAGRVTSYRPEDNTSHGVGHWSSWPGHEWGEDWGSFTSWFLLGVAENPRLFFCRGYHWQISNWRWQCCPGVKEWVPTPDFNTPHLSSLDSQLADSDWAPVICHMLC